MPPLRRPGRILGFRGKKRRARDQAVFLYTKSGTSLALSKALASGGLRKRPPLPFFWRSLRLSLAGNAAVPESRFNGWILVLTAKKIPHRFFPSGGPGRLYVPPMHEAAALHEIRAFEAEGPLPFFEPPVRNNVPGVLFFLLLLLFWHGLRWSWFEPLLPSPPFPENARAWPAAFGLDVYRFRVLHEFWRAATALTLHADDSHLFSNLGFGLLFLIPLCRRAGLGFGLLLTLLAGLFGNAANSLVKEAHTISIGFSTALFGAVGALCALSAADSFRHMPPFSRTGRRAGLPFLQTVRRLFPPVAAGMALLGILGGGGEIKTDYSAHILGFCAGLALAAAALPLEGRIFSLPEKRQNQVQGLLFLACPSLLAAAWGYALLMR